MAERQDHQPGTHVPATGRYEELNVFGTRTGRVEHVREGDRLPEGPRGFTWRQIEEEGCLPSSRQVPDVLDAGAPVAQGMNGSAVAACASFIQNNASLQRSGGRFCCRRS